MRRIWERGAEQEVSAAAIAQVVAEFNDRYAVVNEAGLAIVYEQTFDPVRDRNRLDRITFSDLCKFYLNRTITVTSADGKAANVNVAKVWLSHSERHQYLGGVVFDPTNKAPPDCWNLWTGFGAQPKAGDWSMMREHIRRVICASNPRHFEFLLDWLARMFQQPDKRGEVAIVLRGLKGAGKGIFGRWVHRAFGQHAMHIGTASHLVGKFNAHLRDCVFLFADEAFYAGDRQHEGVLKYLITEEVIAIEPKGRDVVETRNMLHLLMASNSEWVVPASHDERRYFVLDVADNHLEDYPYFAAITKQMEAGGLAAMIHELLSRDISAFNVRSIPASDALDEQRLHSLDSLDAWWLSVLSRGFVWQSRYGASVFAEWHEFAATEFLWKSYTRWCQDARINRPLSRQILGKRMSKMYQSGRPRKPTIIGEVERLTSSNGYTTGALLNNEAPIMSDHQTGYYVESLDEARVKFLEHTKISPQWKDEY